MTINTAEPNYKTLGAYAGAGSVPDTHPEELKAAYSRIEELERALKCIDLMVDLQANDEGLWFDARFITEGYLQQELRKLHAEIETRVAEVL